VLTAETLTRLKWHAGFEGAQFEGVPSIANATWGSTDPEALGVAVSDFIRCLETLNHELRSPNSMKGPALK
jgi:hypothetical protein